MPKIARKKNQDRWKHQKIRWHESMRVYCKDFQLCDKRIVDMSQSLRFWRTFYDSREPLSRSNKGDVIGRVRPLSHTHPILIYSRIGA